MGQPSSNSGKAYVYQRHGFVWRRVQLRELSLVADTAVLPQGGTLGLQICGGAPGGNVIVVGSPFAPPSVQGSATVFRWNGASWLEEQQLAYSSGANLDFFGISVAVDGNLILVGAKGDDVGLNYDQGSVTVFGWNGTSWIEEVYLTPGTGKPAAVGSSVALEGGIALIGAPDQYIGGVANVGRAYVRDLWQFWTDEGSSLGGALGQPQLLGSGLLSDGSLNAVDLSAAAPLATAGLFVALSSTPVPFKGGTLLPFPFVISPILLPTDAQGAISLPFAMPAGLPFGTELWLQWAIQDAGAPFGVALSNTVKGVTQQ